jgi:lysophospholipase L1-like esterase
MMEIMENCEANIRVIVNQSLDIGATVVLTTIFPAGTVPIERRYLWSDDNPAAIDEVNDYIRTLAGENIIILDAFSILADSDGVMRPGFSVDTLHINAAGYNALNSELSQLLAIES